MKCNTCKGNGGIWDHRCGWKNCPMCGGLGKVKPKCTVCGGRGDIADSRYKGGWKNCRHCGGSGYS